MPLIMPGCNGKYSLSYNRYFDCLFELNAVYNAALNAASLMAAARLRAERKIGAIGEAAGFPAIEFYLARTKSVAMSLPETRCPSPFAIMASRYLIDEIVIPNNLTT